MKNFDTTLYFITDSTGFEEAEFLRRVEEALAGGATILQLREKNKSTMEYIELAEKVHELTKKYGWKLALCDFIKNFGLEAVTILGATLYSVWRTIGAAQGSMTMGDCLIVLNSIGTISYALSTMVQYLAEFNEHALYIEDVRYFLAYEPTIKEDPSAPEAKRGDIEFKNVHFKYEGAERESLKGINFRIADGERIAQMVVARHEQVQWCECEILDETSRGAGGFGHTGV